MNALIILAGPTASGKSETALCLAEHLRSEIISADSMQVYRHFDIGTAKPPVALRQRVPHHLIDILEPDEPFTAFDFKQRAQSVVRDLLARGQTPVMVGGTGLYLKTFIENYDCAVEPDPAIRQQVRQELAMRGAAALHEELKQVDPGYAAQIQPNDPIRIERALTVFRQSGQPLSTFHHTDTAGAEPYGFDIHLFLLERERQDLYRHINRRVEQMLDDGLKQEVESLLARGYHKECKPLQSIGYAQMVRHLEGGIPLDRACYEIQRETRHFAKRQITWFKKMKETRSVNVDTDDTASGIMEKILRLLPKTAAMLFGLWIACAPLNVAANPDETYLTAVESVQTGQWDAALGALERLEREQLEMDLRRRVTYLLARVLVHRQEHERALVFYEKSRTLYPELEDYIILHQARSQTALGRYAQALAELDQLATQFPQSLLIARAHWLKADIHRLQNQPESALHQLQAAYRLIGKQDYLEDSQETLPDMLGQQAALYEQLEDAQGLYDTYRTFYVTYPDHPKAANAADRMEQLAQQPGVTVRSLSLRERARRLRTLLRQAHFETVIEETRSLMKTSDRILPGRFYFILADAYQGLRDRAAANDVLQEFMRRYPQHRRVPKAAFTVARNLWNLGNRDGAREGFEQVAKSARRRDLKTEALFIVGKIYEEAKDEAAALRTYRALAKDHAQTEFGQQAAWQIGWVHYRAGRWQEAASQFRANRKRSPQGDLVDKNAFWLAKSLEQLNRHEDAHEVYADLIAQYPYTYYGLQAQNKLDASTTPHILEQAEATPILKTSVSTPGGLPESPGRALNDDERFHFSRAEELIRLGFHRMAREEMRWVARSVRKNYSGVLWLSHWFNRAHAFADSQRLLALYRGFKTRHGEKELPEAFWKNYYPPAYLHKIHHSAGKFQVDPLLVISLMRQESLYDTWSVSPAGARGLMQLMPKTASRMHRQSGLDEDFDTERLFDPNFNIHLGVRYLSRLVREHHGNRIHILIAYNAGPTVLAAWQWRFGDIDDPDVFIESIPYPETRKYVKLVSRNHDLYKRLYGQKTEPDADSKTF
ncbi:tRNA (adenosine(37)-N6)-dimethylallyltransferase MiaA [Nitrospina watsonii]|uniref:tRNA dimethylallyltransferase n=1 Tax=Nitrospina watsonii TaxID=1323948 RepID=A0ABN8VX32_9BACT|nr:tRNA (adenosine(37)-N6)-dimethylallyltransferase MiaA [Nitrospina watsonii]CAI2717472.1 tRNA dimethylallyltransferase [Nitrospina watsonii]